ncbi:MAG: glucose-1-phosphate thymidylyltransferase [Thermoplasmata archaeon HGW-Thermoplasmata-1]|nr:MAG: glucose-1-phosphate thymidylyltransferase [Thermoplasmata archaeon HGW-Thermoplasmata-2]PKK85300.1 MAG: glucose-1-phosphate thymidylyltransferase [Thermoplasmata archaeon HGW-Thermoplasmata-1]
MKGLVLSGGYGTRLRPLTYSQQKQLIPVANKPVLFYAIQDMIDAGIKEIYVIVGPNKEQVMETVRGAKWDAKIDFIYQDEPRGLAHTIRIAKEKLKGDSFAMYLGDNILRGGIVKAVREFEKSKCEASVMLCPVPNPHEFGIATLNRKGEIVKVVEKPKLPPTNLAVIGIYLFRPAIFKAVEEIKPSWRNQLEITDAIQWLIDKGYKVKSAKVDGWWKDTGKPDDILHANRLVLDEIEAPVSGVMGGSISGRVKIEEGAHVDESSTIRGPAVIGKGAKVSCSYIGPYTSIGNGCEITNTEISDSVVMDGAKLENAGKIVESLIGKGAKVSANNAHPHGHKMILGDNSEVKL